MSVDLLHALRAALDDGCSLAQLETTLLNDADTDDRTAAAWLYAWAYDEIRPPRGDLAARITSGTAAVGSEAAAWSWRRQSAVRCVEIAR